MDNERLRKLAGVPQQLEEMKKPVDGQAFGTTDQAAPEDHSVEELSRVADLMYAANQLGGKDLAQKVFKLLPDSMKGEFNYAKWKYKATK